VIARLKGIVEFKDQETCIVDVAGVGYELTCSLETLDELPLGETYVFDVYTHVREDRSRFLVFDRARKRIFFWRCFRSTALVPRWRSKFCRRGH